MSSMTISLLLIEDDAGDAVLIKKMLGLPTKMLVHITHADRLDKGLAALGAEGKFDVVLVDLGLPDSQGNDTFMKVQQKAADLPIIVLTGNDDDEAAVLALQHGAQDYLVKGQISAGIVARSIRYAIERKKLSLQLESSLKEVKVLQGLLPICMKCKKIRDDQGLWSQIESYITLHSEAMFSHGLCPECAKQSYDEFARMRMMNRKTGAQ